MLQIAMFGLGTGRGLTGRLDRPGAYVHTQVCFGGGENGQCKLVAKC